MVLSREREVHGGPVVDIGMGHRPDQREAVGQGGEAWRVLAEKRSGDRGGNRPKLAPDFQRSFGFWVPHFELTLAAARKHHDDRANAADSRNGNCFARGSWKQSGGCADKKTPSRRPLKGVSSRRAGSVEALHDRFLI